MGIVVKVVKKPVSHLKNEKGERLTHLMGTAATVSAIAAMTGGIKPGNLIETDQG